MLCNIFSSTDNPLQYFLVNCLDIICIKIHTDINTNVIQNVLVSKIFGLSSLVGRPNVKFFTNVPTESKGKKSIIIGMAR